MKRQKVISDELGANVSMRRGCPKPTVVHRSSGGDQQETSTKDSLRKLLYAYDLVVVADSRTDLQDRLEGNLWQTWTESLEKTEVLWVGQQQQAALVVL